MSREKTPARLSGLQYARAAWRTMHPEAGDLPAVFVMQFGAASGPAAVSDGRALIAALTPAELADVLGALPALSMARDPDDIRAFNRITKLLRGESR